MLKERRSLIGGKVTVFSPRDIHENLFVKMVRKSVDRSVGNGLFDRLEQGSNLHQLDIGHPRFGIERSGIQAILVLASNLRIRNAKREEKKYVENPFHADIPSRLQTILLIRRNCPFVWQSCGGNLATGSIKNYQKTVSLSTNRGDLATHVVM